MVKYDLNWISPSFVQMLEPYDSMSSIGQEINLVPEMAQVWYDECGDTTRYDDMMSVEIPHARIFP